MSDFVFPVIADAHVHEWKEFSQIEDGVNDRLTDTLRPWHAVEEWLRMNSATFAVNAGDTFHQRNVQRTVVGSHFYDTFTRLFRRNGGMTTTWDMIPGNHDQSTRSGEVHSLYPLGELAHVLDKPTKRHMGEYEIDYLPYADRPDDIRAALRELRTRRRSTKRKILIGHVGVAGAVTGSFEFVPAEQITTADFSGQFDAVLLGHYHKRQVLQKAGPKKPLIMYCGAPIQHTRDDYKEDRGVLLFNATKLTYEVLPVVHAPRFVHITARALGTTESARQVYQNFVYLHHTLKDDLEKLTALLRKYEARGVKPVLVATEGSGTKGLVRRDTIDARHMSDEELVQAYVAKHAPQQADKAALVRLGLDLLSETHTDA